jgi:octaprenyl-diphosphate synthase
MTTMAADSAWGGVLTRLDSVGNMLGAPLERPLTGVLAEVDADIQAVERALAAVDPSGEAPVEECVRHLLQLRGKRLRPMCVALAARTGSGSSPAARELATAAELVHAATLLHDDVVDLGDRRRGAPTARLLYGNAASIFGGDWLLVEAIRRIQAAGVPGLLDEALDVLRAMLEAESLQLARRGVLDVNRAAYLRVAEGKTASLFRWALLAGARAGGASEDAERGLARFGDRIGVAFQVIDDVLDLAGEPTATGKSLYADLAEGKMAFPLVVALERNPVLGALLESLAQESEPSGSALAEVARAVAATGAVDEGRTFARSLANEAVQSLAAVPACPAKEALVSAAAQLFARDR